MSASPALATPTPPPAGVSEKDGHDEVFVDGLIYPPPEIKGERVFPFAFQRRTI
jgi:hypothetical protein